MPVVLSSPTPSRVQPRYGSQQSSSQLRPPSQLTLAAKREAQILKQGLSQKSARLGAPGGKAPGLVNINDFSDDEEDAPLFGSLASGLSIFGKITCYRHHLPVAEPRRTQSNILIVSSPSQLVQGISLDESHSLKLLPHLPGEIELESTTNEELPPLSNTMEVTSRTGGKCKSPTINDNKPEGSIFMDIPSSNTHLIASPEPEAHFAEDFFSEGSHESSSKSTDFVPDSEGLSGEILLESDPNFAEVLFLKPKEKSSSNGRCNHDGASIEFHACCDNFSIQSQPKLFKTSHDDFDFPELDQKDLEELDKVTECKLKSKALPISFTNKGNQILSAVKVSSDISGNPNKSNIYSQMGNEESPLIFCTQKYNKQPQHSMIGSDNGFLESAMLAPTQMPRSKQRAASMIGEGNLNARNKGKQQFMLEESKDDEAEIHPRIRTNLPEISEANDSSEAHRILKRDIKNKGKQKAKQKKHGNDWALKTSLIGRFKHLWSFRVSKKWLSEAKED
ncbi:hypothetical protein BY996DRAFT_8422754 [Phakopsora pachyrhizi]|nr:hypothetical protein BY996DRAFT_8422754 [Phakopsora pachyrhizi]